MIRPCFAMIWFHYSQRERERDHIDAESSNNICFRFQYIYSIVNTIMHDSKHLRLSLFVLLLYIFAIHLKWHVFSLVLVAALSYHVQFTPINSTNNLTFFYFIFEDPISFVHLIFLSNIVLTFNSNIKGGSHSVDVISYNVWVNTQSHLLGHRKYHWISVIQLYKGN